MAIELHDGDVTFQSSFKRIGFTESGAVSAGFAAPRGRQFVVLLLGTVEKGARECDPVAMLDVLGFVPKERSDD